jgi:hypothetical protein
MEEKMLKQAVFDEELIKKAMATEEQIALAKKDGELFAADDEEEGITLIGYRYKGAVYITDVKYYEVL